MVRGSAIGCSSLGRLGYQAWELRGGLRVLNPLAWLIRVLLVFGS